MRWLIGLLVLFMSVLPAQAYNVAGWNVVYFPDEKAPLGCMMSGEYRSGITFGLFVSKAYKWSITLHDPSWNLAPDDTTDVAVFVDRKFIASGKAAHISTKLAHLPFSGADAFKALQIGRRLELRTPYGKLRFSLKGTQKAMNAVLDCVKRIPGTQARSSDQSESDAAMVPVTEAAQIVTDIFKLAGVENYQLEPPEEGRSEVSFKLPDGTSGFFVAARGSKTHKADDYAGQVIGKWSNVCKGDFLSGKQSVPSTDGSVVRKVVTTCRTGEADIVAETTIIRRPNGLLMELSQVFPESQAGQPGQDGSGGMRASIVDAAIRVKTDR